MKSDRAWADALTSHAKAVDECLARIREVPPAHWHVQARTDSWSPSEEALHVALSYEFGIAAAGGGPGMRLRVGPAAAWISRELLLRIFLRAGVFPRGAVSPREVRPSNAEARLMTIASLCARLESAAAQSVQALRLANERNPAVTIVHAYFGPLPPLTIVRLLTVHTRHHARHLSSYAIGERIDNV